MCVCVCVCVCVRACVEDGALANESANCVLASKVQFLEFLVSKHTKR